MDGRKRTSLFLIEQVAAIAIFAVFAAVCSAIIINAYFTANDAKDINYAIIAAKNGAEVYQIYKNPYETAKALGGSPRDPQSADIYYDRNWQICDEADAEFILRFNTVESMSPMPLTELTVERKNGEEIISFTVSAGIQGAK